jgi:hypothetical protein
MMVDWTVPNLTVKAAVALTNQPKVDLAVTTGRMDYVLGAAALYDSATGNVSTWSVGAGYTGLDYQARHSVCLDFRVDYINGRWVHLCSEDNARSSAAYYDSGLPVWNDITTCSLPCSTGRPDRDRRSYQHHVTIFACQHGRGSRCARARAVSAGRLERQCQKRYTT